MIILEDTRNKPGKHDLKGAWFADHSISVVRTKLWVGDYTLPTDQSICIDTKKDIQELVGDICGPQHERFRNEAIRAQEAGIQLVILTENRGGQIKPGIENPTILDLAELHMWVNPRLFIFAKGGKRKYPRATRGVTLMKACMSMEAKYGCRFLFTTPEDSAKRIIDILERRENVEKVDECI